MNSGRAEKVADSIRQALARLIAEQLRDPRVGFVTVTEVQLSPDLKHARVYVSCMQDDPDGALDALNHAAGFLRRGLAREAGLRFTPELRFQTDESVMGGYRMERILEELGLGADDAQPDAHSEATPDAGEPISGDADADDDSESK